jgi:hypothetical protein
MLFPASYAYINLTCSFLSRLVFCPTLFLNMYRTYLLALHFVRFPLRKHLTTVREMPMNPIQNS